MTIPVTRADVIAAAIRIADETGLDAVNMRTVAAALNVIPASLHRHLADTDDLVRGMIDAVVAEYHPALAPDAWDRAVRSRILAARQELHTHPWLQRAIQTVQITPAMIGHTNALAGDFVAGGFSYRSTHYAMQILGHRGARRPQGSTRPDAHTGRSTCRLLTPQPRCC